MKYSRIPLFFIALGAITGALMAWQHWGMNQTLSIFPNEAISPSQISDRINGGMSEVALTQSNEQTTLTCNLVHTGYTHPFCGITFPVKPAFRNINASQFSSIEIVAEVQATEQDTVLIYLLNQENNVQPKMGERANMRPVNIQPGVQSYLIPINSFFVPSWWVLLYPEDELEGGTSISNVSAVRITSGDNTASREMTITVHEIKLHGKYITRETLYLTIIIVWVALTLFFSISNIMDTRRQIRKEKRRSSELLYNNEMLAQEKDRLHILSKTDPLTGALNRAGLEEAMLRFQNELHYRGKTRCALILLDIDHFKQINDKYGHDVGDRVLKEIVQLLHNVVRKTDLIIRLGGEEFLLLCQYTSYREGIYLAEKCRQEILSKKLASIPVTCSFGVADCEPSAISQTLPQADKALYSAKRNGRNKVCGFSDIDND